MLRDSYTRQYFSNWRPYNFLEVPYIRENAMKHFHCQFLWKHRFGRNVQWKTENSFDDALGITPFRHNTTGDKTYLLSARALCCIYVPVRAAPCVIIRCMTSVGYGPMSSIVLRRVCEGVLKCYRCYISALLRVKCLQGALSSRVGRGKTGICNALCALRQLILSWF
jgi:hypothetical protein